MKSLKLMAVLGLAAASGLALAARASKIDTGFRKTDRNHDRKTSSDKLAAARFEMTDADEDGFVTHGELAAGHARLMPRTPAH